MGKADPTAIDQPGLKEDTPAKQKDKCFIQKSRQFPTGL